MRLARALKPTLRRHTPRHAIHFARLDSPSEALRTACGAWRGDVEWTTARHGVTCERCQRSLGHAPHPHRPHGSK
jgi:hypothetical protein